MADLQKDVDSAQRLMRSAQLQAREAVDEKGGLNDKVSPVGRCITARLGFVEQKL